MSTEQGQAPNSEIVPAPAKPAGAPTDDQTRPLRYIGWGLGGMTVFCGAMAVITGLQPAPPEEPAVPQTTIARDFRSTSVKPVTATNSVPAVPAYTATPRRHHNR